METKEIAIIDPNVLSCIGLQSILEELIPMAVIRTFRTFEELIDDTPDTYAHYFVTSQIYFEHTAFFIPRKPKAIVLISGESSPQLAGTPVLNVQQSEDLLIKNILQMHNHGHTHRPATALPQTALHELSSREREVLILITKGFINKEIADKLNISLTTVISHRKNLTEKLGIKSVSGLTIYAVMNGYISPDTV